MARTYKPGTGGEEGGLPKGLIDINPSAPLWREIIPLLMGMMQQNGGGMRHYGGAIRAGESPMQGMGREYAMRRAQSGGPAAWGQAQQLLGKGDPADWNQARQFSQMYATGTPPQFNPFSSQPGSSDPRVAALLAAQRRG